jgi:hypothetical protein
MAATLEISRMMWDSFYTLRDRYQELFSNTPMPRQAAQPRHEAQVIQFARYAEARG